MAVVVNYNSGGWLRSCVTSILESDVSCVVCVVDNASTDHSFDDVKSLEEQQGNLKCIRNEDNIGFSRAVNQVMRNNPADYYVIVNPDCVVGPRTISTIVGALEVDARNGLGSCLIENIDGTPQKTCRRSFPTPWSGLIRLLALNRLFPSSTIFKDFDAGSEEPPKHTVTVDAISGAFMVAKGAAVKKVGLLDEEYFMHCEDLDWCKRFWEAHYNVIYVPGVSVVHAKGVSGEKERIRVLWHLHRGMIRFYQKFYRERYSLPVRWLVYTGVYMRFFVQSLGRLMGSVLGFRTTHTKRQAES
ncbi:MAG: glycosyltransferase family 2 protein [Gammaproteobacteria bacterium]|nr:glycosyltransferase family 2 protein [Gammaproteobacteria bacterium]